MTCGTRKALTVCASEIRLRDCHAGPGELFLVVAFVSSPESGNKRRSWARQKKAKSEGKKSKSGVQGKAIQSNPITRGERSGGGGGLGRVLAWRGRRRRRAADAEVPGLRQGPRGRHPACQCAGVGVFEGVRRVGDPDADGVQRRRAFPRPVGGLQARRRARPPQDHDLQGLLAGWLSSSRPCREFARVVRLHRLDGSIPIDYRFLVMQVYADGTAALPDWEREASIKEFYGVIFPSLLQLTSGITELDDKKQRRLCVDKFRRRDDDKFSQVDLEREHECGICLEVNPKIVLPDCAHSLCLRCFEDWSAKSKSCPFCRACLQKVKTSSLWMYTDDRDVVDMDTLTRENIRRLFMYINKLPLVVLHVVDLDIYEFRIK